MKSPNMKLMIIIMATFKLGLCSKMKVNQEKPSPVPEASESKDKKSESFLPVDNSKTIQKEEKPPLKSSSESCEHDEECVSKYCSKATDFKTRCLYITILDGIRKFKENCDLFNWCGPNLKCKMVEFRTLGAVKKCLMSNGNRCDSNLDCSSNNCNESKKICEVANNS